MEPQTVTVIVYGAKGLKPKKGKHKFSVKFGIGQNKFLTDVVEDLFNNPSWNTESSVEVGDVSKPLKLTVFQKDDVLGQVEVPLCDLPTFQRFRQVRVPLKPHKKCPHPEGELVYEAWVSAHISPDTVSIKSDGSGKRKSLSSGLKKLKGKLSHSPLLSRKSRDAGKPADSGQYTFSLANRGAVSMHDLSSFHGNMMSVPSDSLNSLDSDSGDQVVLGPQRKARSVLDLNKRTLTEEDDESMNPEINGVSPRESTVDGGTKVTIRGENLGLKKDDVVGLYICGSNCLASLEYVSSHKLTVTTKAWKACTGNIVIETQSGGKAVSLVEFAFVPSRPSPASSQEDPSSVPPSPQIPTPMSASPALSSKSTASDHDTPTTDTIPVILTEPPSKPPRKLKAPALDLTPELRRRSDPFALSSSPSSSFKRQNNSISPSNSFRRSNKSISPSNSFKRHSLTPPHVSPLATPSPSAFRRNPPSPLIISDPPPHEEPSFHAPDEAKVDATRPVAEIKPQPTARKRMAPLPPPANSDSRSNSPTPSSEEPNSEVINGKSGNFYDISFVSNEEDTPAPSPTPPAEESTFYFGRKEEKNPLPVQREPPPETKKPIIKQPLGPTKSEFEEYKKKQKQLELEAQRRQDELKRWMDGYKQLQQENRGLKDDNHMMKQYIERLVAQVMVQCPEILHRDSLHM